MFWIIVGIVIVCAICSIAGNAEESAEAEKKKVNAEIADMTSAKESRVVAAFQELLKEEFPDYASQMTFANVDQSLKLYRMTLSDPANRAHFKLFDASSFKSNESKQIVVAMAVKNGSVAISADFEQAMKEDIEMQKKFWKAVNAAPTKAG